MLTNNFEKKGSATSEGSGVIAAIRSGQIYLSTFVFDDLSIYPSTSPRRVTSTQVSGSFQRWERRVRDSLDSPDPWTSASSMLKVMEVCGSTNMDPDADSALHMVVGAFSEGSAGLGRARGGHDRQLRVDVEIRLGAMAHAQKHIRQNIGVQHDRSARNAPRNARGKEYP